jgi:hypothetical protein
MWFTCLWESNPLPKKSQKRKKEMPYPYGAFIILIMDKQRWKLIEKWGIILVIMVENKAMRDKKRCATETDISVVRPTQAVAKVGCSQI